MSIADIRDAFVDAGNGELHCTAARLRYGEGNAQILEFEGHRSDGTLFAVTTEPFPPGDIPQAKAREVAASLLAPPTPPESNPQT